MKTVPSTQRKQASAIIGVSSLVDFAGYKNLKQIAARISSKSRHVSTLVLALHRCGQPMFA